MIETLLASHPIVTAIAYLVLGGVLLVQHSCTALNRRLAESSDAYWADVHAQWEAQRIARENAPRRVWTFDA